MKQLTHDNSNDTWQPISLAAGRLLQRLEEQRPDQERDDNPEKEAERQREKDRFLETRLREIDRFERRYVSGQDRTRRKRN